MLESSLGGFLNRREFQLVDWMFSKCELPPIGGHLRNQAVQIPLKCLSSTPLRIEEQEVTSSLLELDTESLLDSSSTDLYSCGGESVPLVIGVSDATFIYDLCFMSFSGVFDF